MARTSYARSLANIPGIDCGRFKLIVEEPSRNPLRWIRTVLAALAASAILALGAVAHHGRIVGWEQISSVNRKKEGVYLGLHTPSGKPRYVEFSGTDCAVSDERLLEVIKFYLTNPHRRSALDTGPDRLALPARQVT